MARTPDAATDPRGYAQAQGAPGASADAGLRTHLRFHSPLKFVPEEWEGDWESAPNAARLTVQLGGESIRALVRMVVHEDLAVVELVLLPFSRNHSFKQHDFVACKRARGIGGKDEWLASRNAVDEREYQRLASERQARIAAAEQAKRGEAKPRRERRKVT